MALKKITPLHKAIQALEDAMKELRLQHAALVSLLPPAETEKKKRGRPYIVNPITKEKGYY